MTLRPTPSLVRLLLLLGWLGLAGCARFEPRPIAPADSAAGLENRSLDSPALRVFLEQTLGHSPSEWPVRTWDLDLLTWAAFYYHPSLAVARAQWAVAKGGQVTAAQRPNPVLNLTPGYDATTLIPSPWIPLGYLDVPLETAGKRGHRRAQAARLAEAARWNMVGTAWQVRSNLRSSLVDFLATRERIGLLQKQIDLQGQIVQRLEQQAQAGALALSEVATFRIALARARLEWADAQQQQAESRARLSEAVGVPLRAFETVTLAFDWQTGVTNAANLTSAEVRKAALLGRADVLGALAEYAATQAALQLEIAKQYPDVHLQPGYQFDQGDSKWSLGMTVELPVLHQNQGPIAEAKARRMEAAARFNAVQARVLAELERAETVFRANDTNAAYLNSLAEAQAQREAAVAAQLRAGAADQLDWLNALLESAVAHLMQLESQVKRQKAIGALEDAAQRPLDLPVATFLAQPNTDGQATTTTQPPAKRTFK